MMKGRVYMSKQRILHLLSIFLVLFVLSSAFGITALYIVGGALLSYWPLIAAGVVYLVLKVICIHKVKRAV